MVRRFVGALPFVFFVISGACGLVYEVTWTRYFALFLGNTTLACMCVLATFMGGLALGSFAVGSASPRIRKPLTVYGWLEAAIGAYAIAFPLLIRPVQDFVLSQAGALGFGTPALAALKLTAALGVLTAPTVLMGGTFPLLMKHFRPISAESEDKAEWLYAANCGGAVAGAMLAGFSLIPSIGLSHTLWYVGLVNVVVGAAAVVLGLWAAIPEESAVPEPARSGCEHTRLDARVRRAVYLAIALSGATSMVYELVWIRIFAISLGGTTYAFTLMVAAFITGITLGSLAVGAFQRLRRSPVAWFAACEAAIAAVVLASLPLYQRLPYVFWKWSSLLRPSAESMWLYSAFQYAVCFLVMLVPTVFFGATLPLAIKAVTRRDGRIGRDSGFVYGANTLGTLAVAMLTGLVLIPFAGSRHSLETAIVANAAAAAVLLWAAGAKRARLAGAALVPAAAALVFAVPQWHPASLKMGSYGMEHPPATWADYKKLLDRLQVRYFGEDGSAAVAVYTVWDSGYGQPDDILSINGKPDASSYADLPTEVLLGQVPMMLKPGARDVLVVGLGSGVTAGSVLTHPGATVDCVEISPEVVKAARCFSDVNWNVLDNPRMNVILEDARTYVGAARKEYDVIISEPSHPWVAGVANLFSLEFLRSARRVMKPDGVLVQWFQGYDMSDELVGVMLRTVRTVFPYAYVFEGASDDYIIVAARKRIKPDYLAMTRRMKEDAVFQDLARVGVDSTTAFLGRQVLGPAGAARLAGSGPMNTDDLPILEFQAPVAMYADSVPFAFKRSDERVLGGRELFSVEYLRLRPMDAAACISLIMSYSDPRTDNPALAAALLRYFNSRWPGDPNALARYSERARNTDVAGSRAAAAAAAKAVPGAVSYELAAEAAFADLRLSHSAFTPQDFSPVISYLERALKLDPGSDRLKNRLAEVERYARRAF